MAKLATTVTVCDRCGFNTDTPATERRAFVFDEINYKLDLCEPHAMSFDRDMDRWTTVAGKAVTPFGTFTVAQRAENKRIAELRQREQEAAAEAERIAVAEAQERAHEMQRDLRHNIVPGAAGWTMTAHAALRMEQRNFTLTEVMRAVTRPDTTVRQPWRGPHIEVRQREECRVVVNEWAKEVITVIDRSDRLEEAPAEQQAL